MVDHFQFPRVTSRLTGGACALLCVLALSVSALAQTTTAKPKDDDPFTAIGRWLDDSFSTLGSHFKGAEKGIDNFNREAGIAARETGGAVKDAADAVAKLPTTKIISGHQNCTIASNGAPDCVAAANRLCRSKGFGSGTSVDITAAEECPVRVMTGQREAKPGECKNVTFVSRAMCQ
jgi:hypothetical protein